MKGFFLILIMIFPSTLSYGQDIAISQESSEEIIDFAYKISDIHIFRSTNIYIKLFEYDMLGGLPELEGQDLIVKDFFIYVQQRTEKTPTTKKSYWIKGGFYNPRDFEFNTDNKKLTFTFGTEKNPKTLKLLITTSEIKIY